MSSLDAIADWLGEAAGLDAHRGPNAAALGTFVARRARELGIDDVGIWTRIGPQQDEAERARLLNALTVSHSWLFRDATALESALSRFQPSPAAPLQIWVPGCASGEDAVTCALLGEERGFELDVLATDLNVSAIERAKAGRFDTWSARQVPMRFRSHFRAQADGSLSLARSLRSVMRFKLHNLVSEPPASRRHDGRWDLIVCRNVFIYFHARVAARVSRKLVEHLAPNGLLVLGPSDCLANLPEGASSLSSDTRCVLRATEPLSGAIPLGPAGPTESPTERDGVRDPLAPAARIVPRSLVTTADDPRMRRAEEALDRGAHDEADAPRMRRAEEALDRGAHDEAVELLEELLALHEFDPEVLCLLGIAHHHVGRHDDAIRVLRRACGAGRPLWISAFYLRLSCERACLWEDARRANEKVLALCRDERPPQYRARLLAGFEGWRAEILEGAKGVQWRAP